MGAAPVPTARATSSCRAFGATGRCRCDAAARDIDHEGSAGMLRKPHEHGGTTRAPVARRRRGGGRSRAPARRPVRRPSRRRSPGDSPEEMPDPPASAGPAPRPDLRPVLAGAESGELDEGPEDAPDEAPEYLVAPAVVAVVVTRDAGPYLEATLAGLGAQDYPDLTILVVDAGSTEDPTGRVAVVLPGALRASPRRRRRLRRRGQRRPDDRRGRPLPARLPRRRRPRPHGRATPRRGGLPLERRDRRTETGRVRPSRSAPRRRPRDRPTGRRAHRDRAGRARPGATRRRARRLLRLERGDARPLGPVRRARRVRPGHVPGFGGPRPVLAGAARGRPHRRRPRRAGRARGSSRPARQLGPPPRPRHRAQARACRADELFVPDAVVGAPVRARRVVLRDARLLRHPPPPSGAGRVRRVVVEPRPPRPAARAPPARAGEAHRP